jgi:hypothetical protein
VLQDSGFLQARKGFSGWNCSLNWNTARNLGFVAEASGVSRNPQPG